MFVLSPLPTTSVKADVGFVADRVVEGVALTKKTVHVRGDTDKLVTTFEEALGTHDISGWMEMYDNLTTTVFMCMVGLGLVVDMQWKTSRIPTFTAYYVVTAEASIEHFPLAIKGTMTGP